jgi:regulator of protease activity HflC (stomatin/prohibitin superfamily)
MDQARPVQWTYIYEVQGNRQVRSIYTSYRIDLRESVYDFPKQNVITKDNVTMEINALIYYQITDPKAAVYEFDNLSEGIEKLTQTTLRNIIGSMDLDESLVSRDDVNKRLRIILDEATDKWGVKVNRVELQEVNPPADIKQAMEKQMRAERDRRAQILQAEGHKRSAILHAEGERESAIQSAKGKAESQVLVADAEATARLKLAEAESKSLAYIKDTMPEQSDPAQYLLALQYMKTLPQMTEGKDDKLVVLPYEATSLMGSLSGIKELFKDKQ